MTFEVLYLAWNRLEFTKATFSMLIRNTKWSMVSRLVVYDDGSTDGTAEWLAEEGMKIPVPGFEFRQVSFGAPPATMNDYLAQTEADLFAKIDNDIALPKGWLPATLSVMERYPNLELLGMEAARTGPVRKGVHRFGVEPATHIGGVGLMRTAAFHRRPAIAAQGRFGFTQWQRRHEPVRGWIKPDLRVVQLDLIPEEPWVSLTNEYIANGWNRSWPKYDSLQPWWWEWIRREPVAT